MSNSLQFFPVGWNLPWKPNHPINISLRVSVGSSSVGRMKSGAEEYFINHPKCTPPYFSGFENMGCPKGVVFLSERAITKIPGSEAFARDEWKGFDPEVSFRRGSYRKPACIRTTLHNNNRGVAARRGGLGVFDKTNHQDNFFTRKLWSDMKPSVPLG